MKRALMCLALLAAPALGESGHPHPGEDDGRGRARPSYANPSAAIAAELAFAQLAQEKGQWAAFRETAAADAVMFVPQMVLAQAWLKDRANPPAAVRWQPHAVWSSCDGSLMVSHGAWQGAGTDTGKVGWFTTIWQQQAKGGYKWVLDHGDSLAEPLRAPDMIAARVADCPPRPAVSETPKGAPRQRSGKPPRPAPTPFDPASRSGASADGSLTWSIAVTPDGARNLAIDWRKDGTAQPLLIEAVEPPESAAPSTGDAP